MEFGKIKNIEKNWYGVEITTKENSKIMISTEDYAKCCENHGVEIMSGLKYLKESEHNTLFYESDNESDNDLEKEPTDDKNRSGNESGNESVREENDYYDRYGNEPSVKNVVIKTSDGKKCIIKCYNGHNGWYPHTFEITKDGEIVHTFTL